MVDPDLEVPGRIAATNWNIPIISASLYVICLRNYFFCVLLFPILPYIAELQQFELL